MKHILLFTLVILSRIGFAQSNSPEVVKKLKGSWVKTTEAHDTLRFGLEKDANNLFELRLAHGTIPPKKPEGLYEFKTEANNMTIHWMFSSNSKDWPSIPYSIDSKTGQLRIGNFYDASNEAEILVFRKVK